MRLGMNTKRDIFEAHYQCYQKAGKKDKGRILAGLAGTTGLNRDHLAHVLANYGKKQTVKIDGKTVDVEGRRALRYVPKCRFKPTLTAKR
jgi:ABC-type sugar transport system ATPase subunit